MKFRGKFLNEDGRHYPFNDHGYNHRVCHIHSNNVPKSFVVFAAIEPIDIDSGFFHSHSHGIPADAVRSWYSQSSRLRK